MHRDLEQWITQVWKDRKRIIGASPTGHSGRGIHLGEKNPAIWEVYDMYNGMPEADNGSSGTSGTSVTAFIDQLDTLEKKIASGAIVQVGGDFVDLTRGEISNIKATPLKKLSRKGNSITLNTTTIGNAFVHYAASHDQVTKHRIYINVKVPNLGEVFRELMSAIWSERCLSSGKVTGPLGKPRADSIVIYLSDGPGRDTVIEKIRNYYDLNKGKFQAATPKLTVPVKDMPGVATAMEPPSLALVSSGGEFYGEATPQSFGFFRSQLIFMALDRTKWDISDTPDPERFEAFKRRTEKYFRQAGIDPDRPAEQADPKAVKPISSIVITIEGELDGDGMYKPGTKVHKAK